MDVRQLAFLARQPSATLKNRSTFLGLPKRGLALVLANAMFWQPLLAQADGIVFSAPGTTLGQAGNGVPIVNIAAPNGSGLSHNQFSDYNVGQQGVILNNATSRTQSTQLGGIILGNQNLNGTAASVILNEVNGGSPSQLRGYTEVAGQSAHVIVANPYGITCNGCGFINTPQATLTTGKAVIENGQLNRYQVDGGNVAIEGAGLNANNIDRFEIITRSAKLNAEIQAKNLTLIAGANDVDAKTLKATARAADPATAPQLAIDSSALGGMYAGAIKLVSSEAGVGVKLDGKMAASAGDIQLDANGHLSIVDTAATGAVNVKADSLEAKGPVYAGTTLDMNTQGDLTSQNNLVAKDRITLNSGGQLTNNGIVEAGVNADNTRNTEADVSLTAQNLNNAGKNIIASRDLSVTTTQNLNNQAGTLSGQRQTTVTAGTVDNQNKGRVLSAAQLSLTVDTVLNGQGGLINSVGPLTAILGHLNNNGGEVSSKGDATLILGTMDNLTGVVLAENSLDLTATGALNNQNGLLSGWQGLTVNGTRLDNRNNGTVSSQSGNVGVTLSGALLNSHAGAVVSQKALTIQADSLDNSDKGVLSSAAGQRLTVNGLMDNTQGGSISSGAELTLLTGNLDNSHQGTIGADGTLLVTASEAVDNSADGLIASRTADLQVNAASLGNAKGSLQGKGAVNLTVTGDIDNQSGKVIAQDSDLNVTAANLDSRGGALSSVKGALETHIVGVLKNGYDLNNNGQGGTIQAQRLMLKALGGIDNNGGRIAAQAGDTVLNAGTLGNIDNRNGGIYASNLVQISGNDLDNSGDLGGKISANQINFDLLGKLNNRKGIIESGSTLSTTAASLDNQNGQLRALGKSLRTVFAIGGLLDNSNGTLETANTDLRLDAGSFQNQGGSVLHVGAGIFGISMANLNDVGGQLVTHGDLTLDGDSWTNSSSLQANHLTVNVNHLTQTATGQLLSTADFNGRGIDWKNDGQIGTDGSAIIDLSGGYGGKGRLSSVSTLGLHAALISLEETGSIAGGGTSTVNVDGTLTSYGRLTSAGDMTVTAAGINNYGTLGSAQTLTATTGALLNDHGLIFSGGDMGLRVDSLSNRYASIYSLGKLSIDRDGQGALASSIVNSSGSIQSDASMSLAASTIQNVRAVLATNNQGIYTASIAEVQCIENYNAGDCSGKRNHVWQITQRDKFEVTEASEASSIAAGGTLAIRGGDLLNSSSSIASGGAFSANMTNLVNSGIETGETETSRTFLSERTNDAGGLYASAASFNTYYSSQGAGYNPNNLGGLLGAMSGFIGLTETELGQFRTSRKIASSDQSYAAIIQAGGAVNVDTQNGITSSVVRPGYTYVGAGPRTDTQAPVNTFSTRITVNQQLPPDLAQQQVNPVSLPGFSLPVGENGVFRLSGQTSTAHQPSIHVPGLPDTSGRSSPQKYLIETNPVLTDLKQFMSSDYLLSNLGYDPDQSAKRLGDGFYEQKLIQQAVTARTGQRFIDGQTSDDGMFKYLMSNAVASKQELNLQLGVSLTSEQVAALTHDIVWMENATVNGEQVLVPVLYLANANNRLAPNGALIQGSDVTLIAGKELNNAGTLRASNNLTATAGSDMVNSGLLEAKKRLEALAGNNLTNKAGGIIAGQDVSLTAGHDVINERTVTTHESSSGYRTERTDFVDNAARIEAANGLTVNAGQDVNNTGGVLKSGTDTTISAGRDVNLVSVEKVSRGVRGLHTDQTITQYGSTVDAGQDLKVSAGRDVTAIASQIDAKRDVSVAANERLTISSAANELHSSSKTKKVTHSEDHINQVSSVLTAGGNVSLKAGKDLELTASRVRGGGNVELGAQGDLSVLSASNEDASFYSKKSKGAFGRSKSEQRENYDRTNVASVVEAGKDLTVNASKKADGGMNIEGGRDVTVIGSQLKAGGDMLLGATGDIAVLSGVEEHGSYSKKTKSGFLGLSKSGESQLKTTASQVGSELEAGSDVVLAAGNDVRLRASEISAENDTELRAGLVNSTGDINLVSANDTAYSRSEEYKKKFGYSERPTSVSILSAKKAGREAQSSTSIGSQVNADRDATLQAERDINLVGSGISAGRNVSLDAGRDVNVVAAQNTHSESSWEKKKQTGSSISSNGNGFSVFAGTEGTTKKERLERETAAGSQISAGQDVAIDAKRDINQQGSDLNASNDIDLTAGRNINIDAARESLLKEQLRQKESNGLGASINHNYANTKDAVSRAGKGEDNVSKGSSTLKAVDSVGQFVSGPTIDGKFGNSKQSSSLQVIEQTNRSSTLDAGRDLNLNAGNDVVVKGGQLNSGRDINIKGRDVTLEVAKSSFSEETNNTQSWGGIHGGTSGGIKLGAGGSFGTATAESSQGISTPTQLGAGRDINLSASNDLNLIGTQVKAERDIDLNAGNELNIRSAQNDSNVENNRHNGGGEAGLTFGSQGVGVYVSVSLGKGNLEREGERQQEAYLYAGNRLGFTSGEDTNISGATLHGDEVVGRVGGDLNVSSVADTGKVKGKEFDISATGSFVGVSGSVGYGQTTGKTNWVEEQTSITGKSKVDIRTENHTQIDGAVIAADNGNLKLDSGTLGFSDIAGKDKEHGYYLNVGGTYGSGGTMQDGSQVGKGKEGQSGWSVEGWNYEKDREQIVRATVGAGEIVVRNDAKTGADSTVGLNRDVSKAYEITKDEEKRTDLYASSSSIKAVLNPSETLQGWKDSVAKYGENSEEALHKLGDLLLVGAELGSGTGPELVNRLQAARELMRQLGNRNEKTRATTVKALLGRVAPGEQGKDFELVAQRLTDIAGQDPDKAMQVLTVMYRMNLLEQTQQNFVPVLVAGTFLVVALATSLAATQLPPERQAEMQAAVSSTIDSIEKNVRDVNQRAEMVKLIVDVALVNLGLPIHVLDPRLKKYEGLLVNAGEQNPSSGGYAEGGQAATTPHTGGSQLDGQQGGNVYVTPGHQLNPGVVYNENSNADGAKEVVPNPGKTAVYSSTAEDGTVQYVGITDNLEARSAAHLSQKGIEIDAIPGLQNISRSDARAVEQVLIEYNGLGKDGDSLINKINSISTANPIYAESLARGAALLKSIGYPGFK